MEVKTYPTEVSAIFGGRVRWAQWKHPMVSCEPDGWFEKEVESVSRFLKPGDIAMDVGAFTGDTTLPMAVACGTVIAYEPNPMSFEVLKQNQLLNPQFDILEVNAALDESVGTKTFHYSDKDLCNGGLLLKSEPRIVQHCFPLEVRTISVNGIAALLNEKLTYIKLDTEGHDFRILKLAETALRMRHKMPVIKVEIFPDLSREDRIAFYHFIRSLGLTPRYELLSEAKESDFVAHQMINFICTP